jgi:hypothetical protein
VAQETDSGENSGSIAGTACEWIDRFIDKKRSRKMLPDCVASILVSTFRIRLASRGATEYLVETNIYVEPRRASSH